MSRAAAALGVEAAQLFEERRTAKAPIGKRK
jgi:hypothetical protein